MNNIDINTTEKLLEIHSDDPEAKKDDETTKEKEKKEEEKEKKSVWRAFIDIDFYDLFKQLSPLIPTLPSIYAILISMFRDQSSGSLANWYKIFEFIENLNICIYSISATIFYKIFKKERKNNDKVRMHLASNAQKLNTLFLVYCFLISGVKLVLGIVLPLVDDVPDDQTQGLFLFSLFAKLGLILAQLFYLYTVYVKKYYKAKPILADAIDNGFVDESNKKNEDEDDDDTDEKGKDKLKNFKKKIKEKGKKKKKLDEQKKNQEEEAMQALKKENEEIAKKNERLLRVVENLSDANKNWSDLKEEFSDLKKLNFILLKFAKPLLEDIQLKIMDDNGKSSLVTAKVTDRVQDVKHRIKSQLNLPENANKLVLKTNQGEELKDDDFIGENQELKLFYEEV